MTLEVGGIPEAQIDQAVKLFNQVRDTPYRLGLDGNPNKLMIDGVGNCTRKHLYLLPRLNKFLHNL